MKSILFSLILLTSALTYSQEKRDTNYWQFKSIFGVNGTQSSFVNW